MIPAIMQSSMILVVVLCGVRFLRRQSAATRHAILTAGLVSSLVVPFLGSMLPQFQFAPVRKLHVLVEGQREVFWNPDTGIEPLAARPSAPITAAPSHPFLWIWFGGLAIAGVFLVAGAARITMLRLRSKPLSRAAWQAASQEVSQILGLTRAVHLLQNNQAVLGTWGVLRPKIFLPRDAEAWTPERIRVVLTHELAHV